jgi:Ca2+:H+ antiporter
MRASLPLPSDKERGIRYASASSLERAHVPPNRAPSIIRREWFLGVSVLTGLLFLVAGDSLYTEPASLVRQVVIFLWLFAVIMGAALSVVRHAEDLAVHLGEPLGTLILTLAVTAIEAASISAVMIHSKNSASVVRDTLFAVIMIILNGMVGASLLLGAWRHREQHYNLQGANTYLSVIIPLAVLSLIMPNYTQTTPGPTLSAAQETFLGLMCIGLYAAFLSVQTGRHRGYFMLGMDEDEPHHSASSPDVSWGVHAILLIAYMVPLVYLAEQFGRPVDDLIASLNAPVALGGVIIAALVATPEAIGAVRSALANHLQRSINICLGSLLATIGLTIPLMLVVSHLLGTPIYLGLQNTSFMMLMLTLLLSVVTFASGRTNVLQGAVHMLLFVAYVLLIFQG